MAQCLASVRRKLEKEVMAVGHPILTPPPPPPPTPYFLFHSQQSVHLDSGQLVKAVDKLSGKLQAMNRLLPASGLEQ